MAKAHSFSYQIGKKIDTAKVQKKMGGKLIGSVLESRIDEIKVHVFPSGRIRLTAQDKEYSELQQMIFNNTVGIISFIEELIKAAGVNTDAKTVMKTGKQDDAYDYDQSVIGEETRIPAGVMQMITISLYQFAGQFQASRTMTQAGEKEGRRLVKEKKPKNKKELLKLVKKFLEENSFGKMEEVKEEKRRLVDVILRVTSCAFASGAPNINEAICDFTRGVIRGAFAEFKGAETVSVKETRCWAKGDAYCEFEVYSLAA